jgi:Na+-driven multidrug efflux pump
MLGTLLAIVIYIVAIGIIWWLIEHILSIFPPPEPLNRVVRVILVVIIAIIAIALLMQLAGIVSGVKLPGLP